MRKRQGWGACVRSGLCGIFEPTPWILSRLGIFEPFQSEKKFIRPSSVAVRNVSVNRHCVVLCGKTEILKKIVTKNSEKRKKIQCKKNKKDYRSKKS